MNPTKIFYKTSMEENAQFKVLELFGKRGKLKSFSKMTLLSLYIYSRSITRDKHNDIITLLSYHLRINYS